MLPHDENFVMLLYENCANFIWGTAKSPSNVLLIFDTTKVAVTLELEGYLTKKHPLKSAIQTTKQRLWFLYC